MSRLSQGDFKYLVDIINRYGRRIAYEEFKQSYRIPYHEHDQEVFEIWDDLVFQWEFNKMI